MDREALAESLLQVDALEHGTRTTYQSGCKCIRCRDANARYTAARRRRLLEGRPMLGADAPGAGNATAQRIRSLRAEGYTWPQLAARVGLSPRVLVGHTESRPVTYRTALRVFRFWSAQQTE